MWACSTCSELNEANDDCWNCGTSRYTQYNQTVPESVRVLQQPPKDYSRPLPPELDDFESRPSVAQSGLILSTTPTLQTHIITEYLNVVSGEAILGVNGVSDFLSDLLSTRAAVYERSVKQARQIALSEVVQKATKLEAHAVVGIHYETQVINNTLLMVTCWGTAVRVKPLPTGQD